ncbi:MAG TPA: DUF3501 family protein [Acidimicrobiales bacterium]|nr:DUF3501 family protein [Acidimicrobiales bacterium]
MRLTLEDILDLRAYERERDAFRARVIEVKKRRRVGVGRLVTLVFENSDTIRFQIQEMARAERILTDAAIQTELDIYNPLIPEPGELSATLFVELTSQEDLREWLPRLVGIERAVVLRLGPDAREVRSTPEAAHEAQLTREEITASVHYIRFGLDPEEIELFRRGPVVLAVDHPAYREATELSEPTRESLLEDLTKGG